MKPVLIVYATRQGHTRHVAIHLATTLSARGLAVEMMDASRIPEGFSLDGYSAVIVCASVHLGKHEWEVADFVKLHLAELDRIPTAFLSVSLSEAGAEDTAATPERRAQAAADVERMIEGFLKETGWHPARIKAVAGALLFTRYNFLLRFVMKRIARQAGKESDTSQDYEFTDWKGLDEFVDQLTRDLTQPVDPVGAPALSGTNST